MQPSCIHQTEIPGITRLFQDYLYHFDRVSGFYSGSPSDIGALVESARAIDYPEDRREKLIRALRSQNGDSPALAKLAEPGTVTVVTGQQVGLLSGPEFTMFKALTAVKLAGELNAAGVAAVPVFWAASEDHDLAEVDHAWVFDQNGVPGKISMANTLSNGGPVGRVEIQDDISPDLRAALGDLPFTDELIAKVREWYRPGISLASAFVGFVKALLKDFDILFLDPLRSDIREIATPLLQQVAARVPELARGLRERNKALLRAGYHAQVAVDEDTSLLFLLAGNKRIPIRWKDGRFVTKDRAYSADELAADAAHLSPNALLRPVMQDYLLPTASYVAGPSEIAYMAQAQVLYERLLGRMPVMFPRNSFTLLDGPAAKLMARFDLTLTDLLDHQEQVKSCIASKLVPPKLTQTLEALQNSLRARLEGVQAELSQFDVTLEKAAKKSSAKIAYQVEKLARKTANEALRRDQRAAKDAAYLINLVYPHRHLQERFYSIVPFLAKHGLDLPRQLFENIQLTCPHHMVRAL